MSCKNCEHWFSPEKENDYSARPEAAWCTLNPEWVRTAKDHFCGQQTQTYRQRGLAWRDDRIAESMRDHNDFLRNQQSRAVKAEKQLKEARRKLRDAGIKP